MAEKRLKDLEALEVSLVPRAANKRKFLLTKEERFVDNIKAILEAIVDLELENGDQIDEIIKQADLSEQATNAVRGALRILQAYRDEVPPEVFASLSAAIGVTGSGGNPSHYNDKKEKAAGKKAVAKKAAGEKGDEKQMDLQVDKLPEDVKSTVEALWKENQAVIKKAEQLEVELKKEREEKRNKQFVEKAAAYPHLPASAEELSKVLKSVSEHDQEAFGIVEGLLSRANEALEKSKLLKVAGSDDDTDLPVWEKIGKMADNLVEKADAPMTKEQAVSEVLRQNPKLYDEYLNSDS